MWLLAALVIVALPAWGFTYYPLLLRSGSLPSDGDSIMIPMMGTLASSLVLAPVILGLTFVGLRRYPGSVQLFVWDRDRPLRSVLLSIAFGFPAALAVYAMFEGAWPIQPWYEYLFSLYCLLLAAWFLLLRAASVSAGGGTIASEAG